MKTNSALRLFAKAVTLVALIKGPSSALAQNNLNLNSLDGNLTEGSSNIINAPSNLNTTGNNLLNNGALTNNIPFNNSLKNNGAFTNTAPSNPAPLNFGPTSPVNNTKTTNSFVNTAPAVNVVPPPQNVFMQNSAPSNIAVPQAAPSNTTNQAPIMASEKNFQDAISDPEREGVEEKVAEEMRGHLTNDLGRYCLEYCNVLSVTVNSQEVFDTSTADLGFETAQSTSSNRRFKIRGVKATILVDTRFGSGNIEKIQKLFTELDERYPYKVDYKWSKVAFPETGNTAKSEAEVRSDFAGQVRNQLERIVSEFCPAECKLHNVDVTVSRASVDEVQSGAASRYLFARDGRGALYVRGVVSQISIDSQMEPARKQRIESLMREHLLPFGNVTLQVREMPFPRSYDEIQKDLNEERNDPFGLNKLDRMLKMIKEHGNTKEIIKETSTSASENSLSSSERSAINQNNTENSSLSSKELSAQERSQLSNTESNSSLTNKEEGEEFWTQRNMLIVGGIILALLIVTAIGLRFVVTGKRMQAVIHEGMQGAGAEGGAQNGRLGAPMGMVLASPAAESAATLASGSGSSSTSKEEFKKQIELKELRESLIQTFILSPKAAQDVFGRMLRDDGIEHSAKFVTIFGEMIVFELLGDADLKKEIATLAEYVHVNLPSLGMDEQIELLRQLKLRLTASKMRLLSARTLDVFDFLKSKSARQIYELISDESTRCQGIVLTQLGTEKRREIFELFEGNAKVDLLRELSSGDLVPRDYLINVAEALRRKALSRPNFDGENVRGTDVLLDLLERAQLQEQRDLMSDLDQTNAEAARLLRSRLVTVETLPFLRDGLLIEIFLSMEPQAMASFLAGTREHIRRLIFSKAPSDLANGWAEALESMRSIDADAYRLAEMQVISKIRGMASSGLLNLLEVNSSLYPKTEGIGESMDTQRAFKINNPIVA